MNTERIAKLIEILERVPDRQYIDDNWVKTNYNGPRSIKNALKFGFVGDVGGWACQCKSFVRDGLCINEVGYPEISRDYPADPICGTDALREFFDITATQSNALFFNLPTRTDVINYLKDMLMHNRLMGH